MSENASQLELTKPLPSQRWHKMYLNMSTHVHRTHPILMRRLVLTKFRQGQGRNKLYPNLSHSSEDTKCISCVDESPPMPTRTQDVSQPVWYETILMPARTQNASKHVLTKPIPCQREHKINLNMCWPNSSHASEAPNYISTCGDQTLLMPARIQNPCQHEFTKPLPCPRGNKMQPNMC